MTNSMNLERISFGPLATPLSVIATVGLLFSAEASAAILIGPGESNHTFAAGGGETSLNLYVINEGDPLELLGVTLNLQIGDGGFEAGGFESGPPILGLNLFAPTSLFAANNNGAGGGGSIVPQVYEAGTLSQPGSTVTLGTGQTLLGVARINTLNTFEGQTWTFTLDTLNGATGLIDASGNSVPVILRGGFLAAVPEPIETAAAMAGLLGLYCGWRRMMKK